MNTAIQAGLEAANAVCSLDDNPNMVGLLKLDLSRPSSVRLRAGEFWISMADRRLLKGLYRSGAIVRFDLVPSGVMRRYVPLDTVVINAEGAFTTSQILCLGTVDLGV